MDPIYGRPLRGCSPPHRVLIIEDNHDAADSLGRLLVLLGQQVRIAYSGLEGVDAANEWIPTVVISDIGLPGLDGYEVARTLRRAGLTAGVKLIALSAYGTEESRRWHLRPVLTNTLPSRPIWKCCKVCSVSASRVGTRHLRIPAIDGFCGTDLLSRPTNRRPRL